MKQNSSDNSSPLKILDARSSCGPVGGGHFGCNIPEDPNLVAAGWQRRFIGDARMTRDSAETYQALGYEVRLEPVNAGSLKEECGGCMETLQTFKAVYTRKKD